MSRRGLISDTRLKVELIEHCICEDFAEKVENFINRDDIEVKIIQYARTEDDCNSYYSCMIIYREKEDWEYDNE